MVEMVYRARRADDSGRDVIDRYHEIHEDINFHQGWIETESQVMGRAYRRLILRIREATKRHIDDAFEAARRRSGGTAASWEEGVKGGHPDVASAKADFLCDVRDHVSWNPGRRAGLRLRYRKIAWRRFRAELPQASGGTFYDPEL